MVRWRDNDVVEEHRVIIVETRFLFIITGIKKILKSVGAKWAKTFICRPPHTCNYMMFKFIFNLIVYSLKSIELYKITRSAIFNIYKYIIKWRPQHQYKVISTLNVERFLSATVAESAGEGACVDISIIAWKFSVEKKSWMICFYRTKYQYYNIATTNCLSVFLIQFIWERT